MALRAPSGQSACVLARVAVCILLISACSDDGQQPAAESGSTASDQRTSLTTNPADSLALDCRDPIGEMTAPPSGYEVIGDAVALATSTTSDTALQTTATGHPEPSQRLYAKNGLLIRTNTQAELVVPTAWHDRLSFRWGNAGQQEATERLVVGPCDGPGEWIAFPGGYVVSDPACVDFIVRAADSDHRVTVGVGAPCEGQRPPPQPTDT